MVRMLRMKPWIGHILLALILGAFGQSLVGLSPALAQHGTGILRVAPEGADVAGCGSEALPCRTLQNAVNLAASGGTILVARGVYTYHDAFDVCSERILGSSAVVCFFDKELTLLGGYTPYNWRTADPQANPTIIDGEGRWRGVRVLKSASWAPPASLRMEGFIVQNGLAVGESAGGMERTYVWGGGLFSEWAPVTLRHMVFRNNRAVGGSLRSASDGVIGAGAGGGVALNAVPTAALEHVTFDGNEAHGGNGPVRGGSALGGGLFTWSTTLHASFITLTYNLALGGHSDGLGRDAQGSADALGGGAAIEAYSTAILRHVYAEGNRAEGGSAPNGEAGGAYGGGLIAELSHLELYDARLIGNTAQGGAGANRTMSAGIAEGGGVQSTNADVTIERAYFLRNNALGGAGAVYGGAAGGGGAALTSLDYVRPARVVNAVFAENLAQVGAGGWVGGAAGGLWLQGLNADVLHCTFASNRLGAPKMQGQAIGVIGGWVDNRPIKTTANILYTIIADHVNPHNQAALHVQGEPNGIKQVANLTRGLWANNTRKTNLSDGDWAGVINGLGTMLSAPSASFVAPAAPRFDYRIRDDSPARDGASDSPVAEDIEGQPRMWFAPPDIGADEFEPILLTAQPVAKGSVMLAWSVNPALRGKVVAQYIRLECPLSVACIAKAGPFSPELTSYLMTGLPPATDLSLTVEARDATGNVIERSNSVRLTAHFLPLLVR